MEFCSEYGTEYTCTCIYIDRSELILVSCASYKLDFTGNLNLLLRLAHEVYEKL